MLNIKKGKLKFYPLWFGPTTFICFGLAENVSHFFFFFKSTENKPTENIFYFLRVENVFQDITYLTNHHKDSPNSNSYFFTPSLSTDWPLTNWVIVDQRWLTVDLFSKWHFLLLLVTLSLNFFLRRFQIWGQFFHLRLPNGPQIENIFHSSFIQINHFYLGHVWYITM